MCWEYLPDILLEDIFTILPLRERYYCSLVCRNWHRLFYSPCIWQNMTVDERSFLHTKYNAYKGFVSELSHHRVKMCLSRVGHLVRNLTVKPITDYYHLHEFLKVFHAFLIFFEEYPMPALDKFHFTFACEHRSLAGQMVLGTGGKILQEIRGVLDNVKGLSHLTVNQLLLDLRDVHGLLEKLVTNCRETLTYLEILNSTKDRYPLYYVAMLPNLRKLVITPLQLTDDVVQMLSHSELQDLVIVQDRFTRKEVESVSSMAWWDVKQFAPSMRVTLQSRGPQFGDILIQERAPVHAVVYNNAHSRVTAHMILQITDHYMKFLRLYAHLGLPRYHGSRSFHDRADSHLVLLVRECRFLNTLIINNRISCATVLILASEAKNLHTFHVRKNAVIQKCDWPKNPQWSNDFYQWLKRSSRSYDLVEQEVSRILGKPWHMLPDKVFKQISV